MADTGLNNDQLLLSDARKGDESAFRKIYDKYATTLYRVAFASTRNSADADDLLQECFLAFWQNLNNVERSENLGAYLYVSLRNRIFDFYARQSVRTQYLLEQQYKAADSPEEVFSILRAKEIQACIAKAVEEMPEKTREVYLLSRTQELSVAEIALALQRSPQTVKNQLTEASRRVRDKLRNSHLNGWLFLF